MLTYAVEGGGSQGLRAHQAAAVRRAEGRARAARQARADLRDATSRRRSRAGADCVQLFDSWGGIVSPRRLPRVSAALREARDRAAARVADVARAACRSSTSSTAARRTSTTTRRAAPTCSASTGASASTRCAGASAMASRCRATSIPARCSRRPRRSARASPRSSRAPAPTGHIFNLGHGVLPETDPEHVRAMVTAVRELSATAMKRIAVVGGGLGGLTAARALVAAGDRRARARGGDACRRRGRHDQRRTASCASTRRARSSAGRRTARSRCAASSASRSSRRRRARSGGGSTSTASCARCRAIRSSSRAAIC